MSTEDLTTTSNFIRTIIDEHNASGRFGGRVHTRFPPEPNGYMHIGHAKSVCLNFGLAQDYGGKCNLRFDDTNPTKEEQEYVDSFIRDIEWLGFTWDGLYFASDYFGRLYEWAVELVKKELAYVDDLSAEEIREYRGTLTTPGKNSPYRDRSVAENLDLLERMKNGEFPDGSRVLRAKIDMTSPNITLRDPVMYRILHAEHHRTGSDWCIYPLYDWAHGQSDSIEGITHSICTLEFENNRPLYEWFLDQLGLYKPQQIEFARLELNYTITSKRRLLQLVQDGAVSGWDDPRMPTVSGMRRRGYTPAAIRNFIDLTGVSKANSTVDVGLLEFAVRDDLNNTAPRRMAVLDPLKVVIENYPEDKTEWVEVDNYPQFRDGVPEGLEAVRRVPFSREIYIERDDFMEEPAKKFFRLAPGREVRLMKAYLITCTEVIKDAGGAVTELRCTYDPETFGGNAPDGRRIKGTLHWVSAHHAAAAEVRLYDRLFAVEDPNNAPEGGDWIDNLNPGSLTIAAAMVEPLLAEAAPGERFQFLRHGYFAVDPDARPDRPVFNLTVGLKDTWAKVQDQ